MFHVEHSPIQQPSAGVGWPTDKTGDISGDGLHGQGRDKICYAGSGIPGNPDISTPWRDADTEAQTACASRNLECWRARTNEYPLIGRSERSPPSKKENCFEQRCLTGAVAACKYI